MKLIRNLSAATVVAVFAMPVLADNGGAASAMPQQAMSGMNGQPSMPARQNGNNVPPGQITRGGPRAGMPMTAGPRGEGRMMRRHQGGMPMMGGRGGMLRMQMMQQKQAMMQTHMTRMETSLAHIEALLQELVDLQKHQ